MHTHDASSRRRYRGGCGCGAVVYEVELALGAEESCLCSVWEHVASATGFRLLSDEASLSGLQLSAEPVHHFFCAHCGERSFSHHAPAQRADFYSVDLRCLHAAVGASAVQLAC